MSTRTTLPLSLPPTPCTCLLAVAANHERAQHVVLDSLAGVRRGRCRPRVGVLKDGNVTVDTKLESRCVDLIRVVSGQHLGDCPRTAGRSS